MSLKWSGALDFSNIELNMCELNFLTTRSTCSENLGSESMVVPRNFIESDCFIGYFCKGTFKEPSNLLLHNIIVVLPMFNSKLFSSHQCAM